MRKFWIVLAGLFLSVSAGFGQQLTMGIGANDDSVIEFEAGGQACLAASGTTQTFNNVNIKGNGNNKVAIVSISWVDTTAAGTAELSSVSIAGSAATRAVRTSGDNQNSNSEIWYAATNSNSGSVVLTFSTVVDRVTMQAYRLVRFPQNTPLLIASGTTTASINAPAGGVVVGIGTRSNASDTTLSNLTENYSFSCGSGHWGVHSSAYPTASSVLSTTIDPTTNSPLIAMAVWSPGPASGILDGTTPTGAWSVSRRLLSSYTGANYDAVGGAVATLYNQTGANNLAQGTAGARPTLTTAGPNSIAAMDFLVTDQENLSGASLDTYYNAGDAYTAISFMVDAFTSNSATQALNDLLFGDNNAFLGSTLRVGGLLYVFNWDGNYDVTTLNIVTGTAYVLEAWHEAGVLNARINMGTIVTAASGNTTTLTNPFRIGGGGASRGMDGKIFEVVTYDAVPASGTRNAIATSFMSLIGAQ